MIIIDSPIISVNGDSRTAAAGKGKMLVKLEYDASRQYALRYRQLPDGHSNTGWQPNAGTNDTDCTPVTEVPTVEVGVSVKYEVELPMREKVYAVQANFTDSSNGEKYFAAREAYV